MPDTATDRQWKLIALATAAGGLVLLVVGVLFLFGLDRGLIGAILMGVGLMDLLLAWWFARRAAGER